MATMGYKYHAWNIARQLGYDRVVENLKAKIYACVTEVEVDNILTHCRHMA